MKDITPQSIKFIQSCPPAIDDGEYRINVNQNIILPPDGQGKQDVKTLNTIQEFSVKGSRFGINPAEINSVFPPANQTGSYGNCLPHIIINRKTFAWERDIFAKKTKRLDAGNQPIDVTPWVALLSFSKEEAPEIKKNTAKAIISPEPNVITGSIVLDEHVGECDSTPCLTIDIPSSLFNEIVPSAEELKYLAHARYVKIDNKDTSDSKDGYYSVIIGNRFPLSSTEGETNIAHLVSLEGFGEYMPGGPNPITDPNTKIRLISLVNWQYSVKKDPLDFKKLIENLSPGKRLSIPVTDDEPQQDVKNALNMGFTALNHNLRTGDKTVSWYRGPFTPLNVVNEEMACSPCADALLRYDPYTGMFDLSYSTAWQIGRLLALQNKSYAAELYKWRRQNNQKVAFLKMRETLQGKLGNVLDYSKYQTDGFGDVFIRDLFLEYLNKDLGPRLMFSSEENTGKTVSLGDPSGLLKNLANIPGILSVGELSDIVGKSDDPISGIVQKVKERK